MADNGGSAESLMQNDDEQNKEVVNILKEVRANLSEIGKAQLDDEIKQVVKECIEGGDLSWRNVSEIMRYFENVVSVKLGVSLEETKQILRIFLLCWNKQGLAETIWKEIYNENEPEEPEDDEQILMEVEISDDEKRAMFARALQEGHEEVQRIRAMVVGMFSVGKTSLVNNLIDASKNKRPTQLPVDEQYPPSTEGIDVHLCKIENEKWKKLALTQKRNVKRTFERAFELFDNTDSITPVVEHEQHHGDNMDVSEPTDESTQVKETVQPSVNVPNVDLNKLKKLIEPDEIEPREEISRTIHTTAHEEVIKETDIQGNPPLVSVWDFAGKNLYYSTHHFFLNKRSVYLLLMNMTKKLEDLVEKSESLAGLVHEELTCLDAFKFWLNSIHMYSSIHDQEHEDKPTVILIGTHKDLMEGTEEDKEEHMNAFFNEAMRPFIGTNILKHVHDRKFLVNNLDAKDRVFDEIRNEVKKVAEAQPYWNEKHPLKWIQLEKTFEQMRGDGKEMVTLREVEATNRENPQPLEKAQLQLFLEVQHMYGNILYFDTEKLKEHVILSPQWIIEAFKCFINYKEKHVPPKLIGEWQSYKESAILDQQLLQAILKHSAPQIKANADVVVEYMKYLNIMTKPIHLEDYEEQDKERVQQDDASCVDPKYRDPICAPLHSCSNFHILPCQLKVMPTDALEEITNPRKQNTEALCFVFKDNFMPPAIFHRLLAACIRHYKIASMDRKNMMYNNIGVFKVNSRDKLRLWFVDHVVYARISFMSKHKKQAIDSGVCTDVRRVLYRNLIAILGLLPRSKNFAKTTPFEEHVQCPTINKPGVGLFRVNALLIDGEICCEDHEICNQHAMEADEHLGCWYNDVLKDREAAKSSVEGVDLDIVPTDKHLSKIALRLKKHNEIWLIGIELGLRQVDMERIRKDHFDFRVDFVYHVLLEWRKQKNKTLKTLKLVCVAVMKNSPGDIFDIFAALNEEPEVDEQIPMEVKALKDEELRMFARALQEGHEEVQRIRAMVVGMFSVGKTSLVNNLIDASKNKRPTQLPVDEQYPPSTEGIDVHLCKIENEKWIKLALTQKRNVKRRFERAFVQLDFADSITPVVEHEQPQKENIDVSEQTEDNTHVKETVQPPVNVPVDLNKLKKLIEPDEIEPRVEIHRTIHTTAHEEIINETDIQGNPPLVSVWDFAGQNLYYSTHHFFLNKRSIYILLMNMTKKLEDLVEESESLAGLVHEEFTCLDAFKFWLNSIHMYSSIHDQEHEDKPTVILIGTHKDQMKGTDGEKEEHMNALFNEALRPFIGTNILKHVHDRKFLVNNLDEKDPIFDEIRNEVKNVAEAQPYWNEKHPLKWRQLEKTFEQMRGDGKEVVTLREVEATNRKNPQPLEKAQLQLFLEVQHMYGNILYFDTEKLKEHVILSPQWIIEAFKCFINHKEQHVPPKLIGEWQSYKESAILDQQLLQAILKHSAPQIKANADVVVEYMEYLNIMAKPIHLEDYEEQDKERVQQDDASCVDPKYRDPICAPLHSGSNFHILPCQLKVKPTDALEEITNPPNRQNTVALCFVFNDNFMPPAIFHRLLAACIRHWKIASLDRKNMMYNSFGVFRVNSQAQLRLWYVDHIVYARMSFMSKLKKQAIDYGVCTDVRRVLYNSLMAILGLLPRSKNFAKTTPYEEHVQCPTINKPGVGLFRVNALLADGEISCDDHKTRDQHTMEADEHLGCWYNDVLKDREAAKSSFEGVDLDIVPTDKHLSKIALRLKKHNEIWLIGIELGLKQVDMERIRKDHFDFRVDFVYHVLLEWRKQKKERLKKLKQVCVAVMKNSPGDILYIFAALNEEPEVDEQIPMEVKTLKDEELRMFARALQEGHEEVKRIRAMVVGMFSVGKTSLVNNLIDASKNKRPTQLPVDEQYPPSTEGIDVHLCKIENEKWIKLALTQKRNVKRRFERAFVQLDFADSITPVVEHEQPQKENIDVSEQTEDNTHVKETVQPPVNVPVDLIKLKKLIEPDEIEPRVEIHRTIHTTAHEEIINETDIQGNPPLVSVWDFAGQNLYYSTHHFFLNKRSIYILLMNMTKKLEDLVEESESLAGLVHEEFTCLDAFKFWLNSIHMYSSIHDQEHEDKPTVILIGTHKDQMKGTDGEKEEHMNALFNEALRPFIGTNVLKHVHDRKFLVNNLDAKDPVFDEIRNEVKKVAEVQPYWNEKHPLKWIQLEKTFEQMRGDGKEVVTLREVEATNRENPQPLEKAQLQLFLEVQHMYGNILYFDTEKLKEHVILSPQWIIEAFKCFINHKEQHVPPKLIGEWQSYKESAILDQQLLQAILKHSAPQIKANADVVVEYMEYLNIMAKPIHLEDYEEQDKERVQQDDASCVDPKYRDPICAPLHSGSNFHILPCQLKVKPTDALEEITNPPNRQNTVALCFVFNDNFMPPAIFHRLLAACIRHWKIASLDRKNMMYNSFGVFRVNSQAQLRLWYVDHIVYARMSFMSKLKKQAIDYGVCTDVRRVLYNSLMAILGLLPRSKNFAKTTPYEEHVQCPTINKPGVGLFRVNALLADGEISCDDHKTLDQHTMEADEHLGCWYNDVLKDREAAKSSFEGVDLDIVPTDKHLSKIALRLKKHNEIWLIGIELGLKQVDMERIRKDHFDFRVDFVYHVLLEWRKQKKERLKKLKQVCVAVMKNSPGDIFEIFAALKE
ncbi:uncharacterized protein LOC128245701 [Mya arenaria]|uniref:uncharacterized protein LOC128245701 n=1 Tax=Mya arenaria TaxID=6604 RepID=UPI0022E4FE69|nr:uncharacterized protein LOC128245701 [Mya arenaria]